MVKVHMDSAIGACSDYFPKLMCKHNAQVGIIVILHPFGKDKKFPASNIKSTGIYICLLKLNVIIITKW